MDCGTLDQTSRFERAILTASLLQGCGKEAHKVPSEDVFDRLTRETSLAKERRELRQIADAGELGGQHARRYLLHVEPKTDVRGPGDLDGMSDVVDD